MNGLISHLAVPTSTFTLTRRPSLAQLSSRDVYCSDQIFVIIIMNINPSLGIMLVVFPVMYTLSSSRDSAARSTPHPSYCRSSAPSSAAGYHAPR